MITCHACGEMTRGESTCEHCGAALRPVGSRRSTAAVLLGLTLGSGCNLFAQDLYGIAVTDDDQDGYFVPDDCDDANPDVHPGADETAGDGVDSNCDGEDDPADTGE